MSNGDRFKVIRRPFKFPTGGYFWLVGMVASKSNRALNDWIRNVEIKEKVKKKKLNNSHPKKRCKSLTYSCKRCKRLDKGNT